MRRIRIEVHGRENLYRYSRTGPSGYPLDLEAFNLDPCAREYLGRWGDCPNFNVGRTIAGLSERRKVKPPDLDVLTHMLKLD